MTPQETIAQAIIDIVSWVILPVAVMIAIEWAISFFRGSR